MNSAAEGGINLEPSSAVDLLEKLEEWSEVLKGDEELTYMLRTFQNASDEGVDSDKPDADVSPNSNHDDELPNPIGSLHHEYCR